MLFKKGARGVGKLIGPKGRSDEWQQAKGEKETHWDRIPVGTRVFVRE